jgi:hypothetical protein
MQNTLQMPPSGHCQIHDLLQHLSRPGQIFKFDNGSGISDILGEISVPNSLDTCLEQEQAEICLKKIVQDHNLQKWIYVALDEGAEIFMVAGKNYYYEILFNEEELPPYIRWKYNDDLQVVLIDRLDERYHKQGAWVNLTCVRGAPPLILLPTLGEKTNDATFLEYQPPIRPFQN